MTFYSDGAFKTRKRQQDSVIFLIYIYKIILLSALIVIIAPSYIVFVFKKESMVCDQATQKIG